MMGSCPSLHELFEAQVGAFPARTAVTAADHVLTYQELNDRADVVAARLRAAGADSRFPVGLCIGRSADMIVGLLGILKSGAPYLPIDPTYPRQRIQYLIDDSKAQIVVTASSADTVLLPSAAQVITVDGDEQPPELTRPQTSGEDLAYVIYTSGSTGAPKGVLVEHRNIVRLFEQARPIFRFHEHDVWSLFHSISFDFSVWEIFGALLHGGRLVIVPAEVTKTPLALLSMLESERVTVFSQTPSAFWPLTVSAAGETRPRDLSLRLVILGGERLTPKQLELWIGKYGDEHPQIFNMYGITETTVHVTSRRMRRSDLASPALSPIGEPLADTRVSLRDALGNSVRTGEPGEIFVAGPGVARGYLGRPELTAERFLAGMDGAAERWYRSGDRAAQTESGDLVYLGRVDDQVKVRGFRIEPGEVEARLTAHPGVATAVVTAEEYGDGDGRLVAYIVPRDPRLVTEEETKTLLAALPAWAAEALPQHMCPSLYRLAEDIPLTPSGKIARQALGQQESAPPDKSLKSASSTEDIITELVSEIVSDGCIGADEDLFDHGITSVAFMRILIEINLRFDVQVTGAELDEATIGKLVSCVESQLT
jgi:amino acid adenylation domain-containing protein